MLKLQLDKYIAFLYDNFFLKFSPHFLIKPQIFISRFLLKFPYLNNYKYLKYRSKKNNISIFELNEYKLECSKK
jgi:hypothetical protein